MTVVCFVWDGIDYICEFRYDPDLVELVKSTVPASSRSWSPTAKRWRIASTWVRPLAQRLERFGYQVVIDGGPAARRNEPPPRRHELIAPTLTDAFAAILESIPPEHRAKAYKAISRGVHPDHLGSELTAVMQALNIAYHRIREKAR